VKLGWRTDINQGTVNRARSLAKQPLPPVAAALAYNSGRSRRSRTVPLQSLHRSARGLSFVLFLGTVFLGCSQDDAPKHTNILLISIDTLRADHLSGYGYPRPTSPVLDELAATGVRFDHAVVQWPKTGPSFASMFTSTYPKDNGIVRKIGVRLPDSFLMLAEALKRESYATRAVVANGAVASEFNFNQGFDTYVESWKLSPPDDGVDPTGAEMITQLARTVMEGHDPQTPYFLWVHYLDPHFPYQAPAPWTDHFAAAAAEEPSQKLEISEDRPTRQMLGIGYEQVLGDSDDLSFYVARYDAEIAYTDAQVGELLDFLRQQGLMDDTLTVITSDHGESLGEHHYFFDHGRFSFQPSLRVPLIFHQPGVLKARVDTEPVELLDLTPTLLQAAGISLDDGLWMQGKSLWPRLTGTATPEESDGYAFAEAGYAVRPLWQRAVTDGRYKLIYAQDWGEQRWIAGQKNPLALYDLSSDPGETVNLVDELPAEAARLHAALENLWSAPPYDVQIDRVEESEQREMDEETRRQLKALGYLD